MQINSGLYSTLNYDCDGVALIAGRALIAVIQNSINNPKSVQAW